MKGLPQIAPVQEQTLDGGIVKTDESGVKVPSSLRAIGTRGVYRLGANGGNTGTENRPRNIAFNYIVRAT
ncbi:Uncharacterised protein [Salmonella enterica subsp. enterica serovar Typhi]|nr:Uncharacterised protein [Salmonella enterica subsp. enterica serovar Typhi]CHF29525.1 Uncharacterised protein [Salmonella enterica subsp. enterica serovar Typhi]